MEQPDLLVDLTCLGSSNEQEHNMDTLKPNEAGINVNEKMMIHIERLEVISRVVVVGIVVDEWVVDVESYTRNC